MLINEIIDFCNKKYKTYGGKCGNRTCNHPHGKCSGSCYNCLFEIHFPKQDISQKLLYDCQKMIYHYVCQYSYRYASEMLHALNICSELLTSFEHYHIMSIGCGSAPDLMALEAFCNKREIQKQISFKGYDINEFWKPIHQKIERYCESKSIVCKFRYEDALRYFSKYNIKGTNIIVISYLISYLYNTKQIIKIDEFFNYLVDNVISRKQADDKVLIIINDVNSNKRGRNYFDHLQKIIRRKELSVRSEFRYFDNGNLNDFQKIGSCYKSSDCLFKTDMAIRRDYNVTDLNCRSIQLIMEVK